MTIVDLASYLNCCLPSIEQIKAHHLRIKERMKESGFKETIMEDGPEQLEESRSQKTFTYDIDRETDVMEEKLYQLIERTNIQNVSPGTLSFYNEIRKSAFIADGFEFARYNDHYKICLDRQTSNIIWYAEDEWEFEVLARDLDQFLLFVVECRRYDMHLFYQVDYVQEERFKALDALIKQGLSYEAVTLLIQDFQ